MNELFLNWYFIASGIITLILLSLLIVRHYDEISSEIKGIIKYSDNVDIHIKVLIDRIIAYTLVLILSLLFSPIALTTFLIFLLLFSLIKAITKLFKS